MSNSSLVSYTRLSPHYTEGRKSKIDMVIIHCMAGNLSVETCGNVFVNKRASSNYGIGSDGRIALYVEEKNTPWTTGSDTPKYVNGITGSMLDKHAITIEVANDGREPDWHVSDKAIESLINLLVDICKRNDGIGKLKWSANKNLTGRVDLQNVAVHRWYAPKACPGDYLYGKIAYITNEVNRRIVESTANNTTYDGLDYAPVFDFDYYVGKYEDLRNAFGNDKKALFNHFINYGMKEGRQATPDFNVKIYKDNYADLQNAFMNDLPAYYRHYCVWGKNEGRIANMNINGITSSAIGLENPVTKYGNIDYSDVYDYNYYINHYADLRIAFEFDDVATLQHFVNYGMNEGRQAKSSFDVFKYKERYADLRNAFCDDLKSYYLHYIYYGKKEGRVAN